MCHKSMPQGSLPFHCVCILVAVCWTDSCLKNVFFGNFLGSIICHKRMLKAPPKKRLLTTKTIFISIVFVVWLWSVEQTNYITAKCEWRKLSRERACGSLRCEQWGISGFCFTPHARTPPKMGCVRGLLSWQTKCEWKPQVQVLHVLIAMFS